MKLLLEGGYAMYSIEHDHIYIDLIYVVKKYRRQGWGRFIVRCLQHLSKTENKPLVLVAKAQDKQTDSKWLLKFYTDLGFTKSDQPILGYQSLIFNHEYSR
jgi:GNAT superfamily N-acetyltransferase